MNPSPAAAAVEHGATRPHLADRFAAVRARTLAPAARWRFSGPRLARDGAC